MLTTKREIKILPLLRRVFQHSRMAFQNRVSRTSVIGDAPVAVSLTSYGARVASVYLTIESIARGRVRPQRLVLWLDNDADLAAAHASPTLRRLVKRGLTIGRSHPMGPHSKYFPYATSQQAHVDPLATADDDVLYPRTWLSGLMEAQRRAPEVIHCYRAHRVELKPDGALAPYMTWESVTTTEPRYDTFLTGVSGVIYPPSFLDHLRDQGEAFRVSAPHADDVWLHAQAIECGVKVAQIGRESALFPVTLGTQKVALWRQNAGGNDAQLAKAYSARALTRLREEKTLEQPCD